MPSQMLRVDKVNFPDGRIVVFFSDGSSRDFDNVAQMQAQVPAQVDPTMLQDLLLRYYLEQDPSAADDSVIEGRVLTLNFDDVNGVLAKVTDAS